jgi:hypothetical protein
VPKIEISPATLKRLQVYAEPLVDSVDDVISRLLDTVEKGRRPPPPPPPPPPPVGPPNEKTPSWAFYGPIVKVLREAGGELPTKEAVDRVGKNLGEAFTAADLVTLASGEVRWRNAARWARNDLADRGVIDRKVPTGVWRLSGSGGAEHREIFPWPDVTVSREDKDLQGTQSPGKARETYLQRANPCPECRTPPEHLAWVYFSSPVSTWESLCGREGWMTICDWCERQVGFFMEALN